MHKVSQWKRRGKICREKDGSWTAQFALAPVSQRRAKRACNGLGPRDVNPHVDEGGDDSIEEAFRGKHKPNPRQRRAKRACNGLGPQCDMMSMRMLTRAGMTDSIEEADEATTAMRLSDRDNVCVVRSELKMLCSHSWVRATDGESYEENPGSPS